MSGEIQAKYDEVFSKTQSLRTQIAAEINDMESRYKHIQEKLYSLDGENNAALKETMEKNRQKILATATTLEKLLLFMVNSSKQVEESEGEIATVFESLGSDIIG